MAYAQPGHPFLPMFAFSVCAIHVACPKKFKLICHRQMMFNVRCCLFNFGNRVHITNQWQQTNNSNIICSLNAIWNAYRNRAEMFYLFSKYLVQCLTLNRFGSVYSSVVFICFLILFCWKLINLCRTMQVHTKQCQLVLSVEVLCCLLWFYLWFTSNWTNFLIDAWQIV